MAIAPFGSASNPSDNGTLGGTEVISITPPSSMTAGQLVLVYAICRNGSNSNTVSNAGGQTWSSAIQIDGLTTNISAALFWCRFNGTWSANPSFSFSNTTATTLVMLVYDPTNSANTWAVDQSMAVSDLAAAGAGPYTITGQTTTQASTVTIASWMTADDNSWTSLSGTGWNVAGNAQYRNLDGSDESSSFAHKIQTSAGPTGNVSKSQTTVTNDATLAGIITFYEISSGTTVSPGVGQLDATGFAPTATTTSNQLVSAGVGAATLAGLAPVVSVSDNKLVSAGLGELSIVGFIPSVIINNVVYPDVGALALEGFEPSVSVSDNKRVDAGLGEASVEGFEPTATVTENKTVDAGVGELSLDGFAPNVNISDHKIVSPGFGEVAAEGFMPSVSATENQIVATGFAELLANGYEPTIFNAGVFVDTGFGELSLIGYAPEVIATGSDESPKGSPYIYKSEGGSSSASRKVVDSKRSEQLLREDQEVMNIIKIFTKCL